MGSCQDEELSGIESCLELSERRFVRMERCQDGELSEWRVVRMES